MFPFAWLIGLVLPACAATGAGGLPTPPPMDMAKIERPATPNTALAGPAAPDPAAAGAGGLARSGATDGLASVPDIVTPHYPVPAARLFAAITAVALAQPRTFLAATYPDLLQAHFVARSRVFNFPDLIAVQVRPDGLDPNTGGNTGTTTGGARGASTGASMGGSTLVLYSRSVYGRSDLGVNRGRLVAWLAALDASLHAQPQR
jgi:uncharacterized protein (DUF1499 family)